MNCMNLVQWLESDTGVQLQGKEYLVSSRLSGLMRDYRLQDYDDLFHRLNRNDDQILKHLVVEALTTHETRFFRDEGVFEAFRKQIIPEWIQRKKEIDQDNSVPLRIWSAGCSTGQEPYSLAILLLESFPALAQRTTIIGTDISEVSLHRAMEGRFTEFEIKRGLSEDLLNRYFQRSGDAYHVSEQVRRMVSWKNINLIRDPGPEPVDIIFCRNVIIYFGENRKSAVYKTLMRSLKSDGTLVLGTAESPPGGSGSFIRREYGMSQYYEANLSQVTLFRQQ